MKIYIIPVEKQFQPNGISHSYPQYNSQYGVEQDIIEYIRNNNLETNQPENADWFYLPIFWTRWHVNHGYAKTGVIELQNYINSLNYNFDKVFTICQYDDGVIVNLKGAKVFLSSRKTNEGIDIPLLARELSEIVDLSTLPKIQERKIFASFAGVFRNHPIREKMASSLAGIKDVLLYDGNYGTEHFINLMANSKIALCPRGYGGSSFRFYEAMQLGAIPFLIGDIDTRPFKNYIDWDSCSLYLETPNMIKPFLENITDEKLDKLSENLPKVWDKIKYGSWGKYVIKEIENGIR